MRTPGIAWERTTRRVLTLQDVSAIKVNDLVALRAAGIDPAEVATEFATVMFDQLFVDGFFHGDAHPGNIFVTPLQPGADPADAGRDWALTFVDFGMMGQIPDTLRERLAGIPHRGRRARRQAARREHARPRRAAADCRHPRPRAHDVGALRPVRRHGVHRAAGGRPAGAAGVRAGVRRDHPVAAVPAAGELPAHHPRGLADLRAQQHPGSGVQHLERRGALRGTAAAGRGRRGRRDARPRRGVEHRRGSAAPPPPRRPRHAARERRDRGRDAATRPDGRPAGAVRRTAGLRPAVRRPARRRRARAVDRRGAQHRPDGRSRCSRCSTPCSPDSAAAGAAELGVRRVRPSEPPGRDDRARTRARRRAAPADAPRPRPRVRRSRTPRCAPAPRRRPPG